MPALISRVADWQTEPLAAQLAPLWSVLATGVLDRMLMEASSEAVDYVGWPLMTPPATTAVGSATAGSEELSVAAAVNIGPLDVLGLPSGAFVEVQDAEVSDYTDGYPGTIYLNAPLPVDVAAGDALTVYRQYRYRVRGKATRSDDLAAGTMTQEAQIAMMHAPTIGLQGSARVLFVPYRPLHAVAAAFQELPWTNDEEPADTSGFDVNRATGAIRLPIGYYNPPQSIWRLYCSYGYRVAPYALRKAVHLLLSANVAKAFNPTGAMETRSDSGMVRFTRQSQTAGTPAPLAMWIEEAQAALDAFKPDAF